MKRASAVKLKRITGVAIGAALLLSPFARADQPIETLHPRPGQDAVVRLDEGHSGLLDQAVHLVEQVELPVIAGHAQRVRDVAPTEPGDGHAGILRLRPEGEIQVVSIGEVSLGASGCGRRASYVPEMTACTPDTFVVHANDVCKAVIANVASKNP